MKVSNLLLIIYTVLILHIYFNKAVKLLLTLVKNFELYYFKYLYTANMLLTYAYYYNLCCILL